MSNPFSNRAASLNGPASDAQPVVPNDSTDLSTIAIALYVEKGGSISIITAAGNQRLIALPDFAILPVGVRRVRATGTTATGIHALVLA
jgi:hypothetical protein